MSGNGDSQLAVLITNRQWYFPTVFVLSFTDIFFVIPGSTGNLSACLTKKWAFLSDCARLKIIYQEGGIYLDTDVELLKPLDPLLEHACYLAEETTGLINTGLGFGAEKGNPVIGELLQQYNGHFQLAEGIFDSVPCPRKNTEPIYKYGYMPGGAEIWTAENVCVVLCE